MATRAGTITTADTLYSHTMSVVWASIGTGDVSDAYEMPASADRSVQLEGTVTAVAIEGSNEPTPTNWHALHDLQGNSLGALSATGIYQISEITRWIRVNATTATGVTATLIARSPRGS